MKKVEFVKDKMMWLLTKARNRERLHGVVRRTHHRVAEHEKVTYLKSVHFIANSFLSNRLFKPRLYPKK